MTDEDEAQRKQTATEGFGVFIERLTGAVDDAKSKVDYEKVDSDEFDYEKLMRESDARTDKYGELLDKHGFDENSRDIIDREMGWIEEEGEGDWHPPSMDDIDPNDLPEMVPDPLTEGRDWIRGGDGCIGHPLQEQCSEGATALWREIDALGLKDAGDPQAKSQAEFQITAAKLAGALNSLAYGRYLSDPVDPMSGFSAIRMAPVISWESAPGTTYRVKRAEPQEPSKFVIAAEAFTAPGTNSIFVDTTTTARDGIYLIEKIDNP